MKQYIVTVKHDNGQKKIRVNAMNEEAAKYLVCMAEGCPETPLSLINSLINKNQTT